MAKIDKNAYLCMGGFIMVAFAFFIPAVVLFSAHNINPIEYANTTGRFVGWFTDRYEVSCTDCIRCTCYSTTTYGYVYYNNYTQKVILGGLESPEDRKYPAANSSIVVYYDVNNPNYYRISFEGDNSQYSFIIAGSIIASVFFIFAAVVLIVARRRAQK